MSTEALTGRDEFAMRILQGFCGNPAIFAPNPGCGWSLVNCTAKQLLNYVYDLADEAICTRRPIRPPAAEPKPAGWNINTNDHPQTVFGTATLAAHFPDAEADRVRDFLGDPVKGIGLASSPPVAPAESNSGIREFLNPDLIPAAQTALNGTEFTLDEAMRYARANAYMYEKVPSVSRVLLAEVERLTAAETGADVKRMDWLVRQIVEVRTPLRYGSLKNFLASPDDDDGEILPSDLRSKIDAAESNAQCKPTGG